MDVRPSYAALEAVSQKVGDCFYVVKPTVLVGNLEKLLATFREVYPQTGLAYSYKTNYDPALCGAANDAGFQAEVVSGIELALAQQLGVPPQNTIFNGPLKRPAELRSALLSGCLVNIDSLWEASDILHVARENPGAALRVGLRCAVGALGDSRFGLDRAEIDEAIRLLAPHLQIESLHSHASSPRTVESYEQRTREMLDLYDGIHKNLPLQSINLGGGFFGPLSDHLKAQFHTTAPSWAEYARAIAHPFARRFSKGGPDLILEPGVAVAADAMSLVVRVTGLKKRGGRTIAFTTGSVHLTRPSGSTVEPEVLVIRSPSPADRRSAGPIEISGYTCMENDYLQRDARVDLAPGDYLLFKSVGAYSLVLKPPFIQARPAVVVMGRDGDFEVERRSGDLASFLGDSGGSRTTTQRERRPD